MNNQIRTQKYAQIAYKLVEAVKGSTMEAKYRTLALNMPTMIMQSGLSQVIGFLMAKNESHHKEMLEHLETLLNSRPLHKDVIQSDVKHYQNLSRQAIEAASWLKRYTQAMLKEKEGAQS